MLLFIRKHFHKRLMQGLVIVMLLSLIGIGSLGQLVNIFFSDRSYEFTINGHGVSRQLFMARAAVEKRIIDFYKEQLGDLAPRFLAQAGMDMSPEKNAYNKIIQEVVLADCMNRSGLLVSTQAIAHKARDPLTMMHIFGASAPRALYDRNGKLQQEILMRWLSTIGLTVHDFEKLLEEAVQKEVALDIMHLSAPVTQKEIDSYALKEYGTREFSLTTYSLATYLQDARKTEVSKDELERFFNERNGQSRAYWTQEKRSGTLWKIPTTEKNREKIYQAASDAIKGDATVFNTFLAQHKAHKSQLSDVTASQKYSMLFQLALNDKGLVQEAGSLMIVIPTHITPSQEQSFADVEQKVRDDYYLALAQKAMVSDLEGAGVSDIHKTGTQRFVLKPGSAQTELEKLTQRGFQGDRIKNMVVEGSHLRGIQESGGFLVTLERVERIQDLTPEQYATARSALMKENSSFVTAASVDSLLKSAKIKNNKL